MLTSFTATTVTSFPGYILVLTACLLQTKKKKGERKKVC